MQISGRIRKEGKHWLVELPILDAMTQGRSRAEAVQMSKDLVETMADEEGFSVDVRLGPRGAVSIGASDVAALLAMIFRRQREKHGLSVADVARRLGMRLRAGYARYDRGRTVPSVGRLFEILAAAAPGEIFVVATLRRAKSHRASESR